MNTITVRLANFADESDARAVVMLLDAYASDPAGGGEPLSAYAKANLVGELACRPQAFSLLAFDDGKPVGLVNCIEGFSTFACRPLVNVHDVAVLSTHRGRGVGRLMLQEAEQQARNRGACKLTLEVLTGNQPARSLYLSLGFADYQLDPTMGHASFMQKWVDG